MKTRLSSLRQFLLLITCLLIFFSSITAQVFWTEDFNGGLPDSWTAQEIQGNNTANSNWVYTTLGPIAMPPIQSSSASNGWMLFDSDDNCSGAQELRLISPRINCVTKTSVYLQFETLYRRFNDLTFLEWSTDSIQWNAIPLFEGVTNSQYGDGNFDIEVNPQKVVLDLTAFAAGEDSLFLAFKFIADKTTLQAPFPTEIGCAFSWQIDDIQLSVDNPTPEHDLRVNSFYAIAPNAITPHDQHIPFGFVADIQNIGQQLQTGVQLKIYIKDEVLDQIVYTDSLSYGVVPANTIVENEFFLAEDFLPTSSTTSYIGSYEIFADSIDTSPSNNLKTFNFISSDSIFAKETGISFHLRPNDDAWPANVPHSWSYGNYFFIPNGANKYASKVSFGLGNPTELKDQLIQIRLYKWNDMNEDQICDNSERTTVAAKNYFVTGNEAINQFITVNLYDGSIVPLEDNTAYLVMIEYTPFNLNRNMELSVSSTFDYSAQWYRSNELGEARFSSFLGFGSSMPFSSPGFAYNIVPAVRLHISDNPPTATEDFLAAIHQIQISPNPANKYLNINIQLNKQFKKLDYRISDESGKLLLQGSLKNIKEKHLQIETAKWTKGIYFLSFSSEEGSRTLSFVVQ